MTIWQLFAVAIGLCCSKTTTYHRLPRSDTHERRTIDHAQGLLAAPAADHPGLLPLLSRSHQCRLRRAHHEQGSRPRCRHLRDGGRCRVISCLKCRATSFWKSSAPGRRDGGASGPAAILTAAILRTATVIPASRLYLHLVLTWPGLLLRALLFALLRAYAVEPMIDAAC